TSVEAMKAGALDFLTKPIDAKELLNAIHFGLRRGQELRTQRAEMAKIQERFETLTPREQEVLGLVVQGRPNKQIASELGTVEKTIKVHRARVMEKMGAESLAELVRIAEKLGIPAQQTV